MDENPFFCSTCNQEVDEDANFCPHCGEKFTGFEDEEEFECTECGATVKKEATSCPNCGANFEETINEEQNVNHENSQKGETLMSDIKTDTKNSFQENFSFAIILVIAFIAVGIILPVLGGFMPSLTLLNDKVSFAMLLDSVASILMVIILVMLFKPLAELSSFLILNLNKLKSNQETTYKALEALLLFLYTFPIYQLLAAVSDEGAPASTGIMGALLLVINQATDFGFQWLYTLVKIITWIWGLGTFVYLGIKIYPLIRIYSDKISEQAEIKLSEKEKDIE